MKRALDTVNERILAAFQRRQQGKLAAHGLPLPRLVAVSKLKPASAIVEAYEYGQRFFGENYIQELVEKSNSPEIIEKCPDIKFHFIGHLQSNKVNKLLKVRNLHMVETVDSVKLADLINKAIHRYVSGDEKEGKTWSGDDSAGPASAEGTTSDNKAYNNRRLKVMIQVNTSGEEQKNGIDPEEAPTLADHIANRCEYLELAGLMTIGRFEGWNEEGPNKDFLFLHQLRESVSQKLSVAPNSLELSMGMSGDFEEAIELGSTSVRVGTLIFGERKPKQSN